jgi:hypothetical protein
MFNVIGDKIRQTFSKRPRHSYAIGGRTYVQTPLVLGQFQQLFDLLEETMLPLNAGAIGMITALGSKLSSALAIVLTEEGKTPQDKDLAALAEKIKYAITAEMAVEIVDDFFICNPLPLILKKIAGLMSAIGGMMPKTGDGSQSSASSSATETLQSGTPSSGA